MIFILKRAQNVRPDSDKISEGIKKSKDAILNSLVRGKAFEGDDIPGILAAIIDINEKEELRRTGMSRIFEEGQNWIFKQFHWFSIHNIIYFCSENFGGQ